MKNTRLKVVKLLLVIAAIVAPSVGFAFGDAKTTINTQQWCDSQKQDSTTVKSTDSGTYTATATGTTVNIGNLSGVTAGSLYYGGVTATVDASVWCNQDTNTRAESSASMSLSVPMPPIPIP